MKTHATQLALPLLMTLAAALTQGCGIEKTAPVEEPAAEHSQSTAPETDLAKRDATKDAPPMVSIPGGEFIMGDDNGQDDAQPAHTVGVSAFYMDAYEVTQESYQALMGSNPAKHKNPKHPVEQLGWYGAIKYCNMRSLQEGLSPCYDLDTMSCDFSADGYRLPTEAEWEYACRAGSDTAYSFGDRSGDLDDAGWFEGNANSTTHPVGMKKPNAWGLYDMHGNVYEWCNDTYSETFYTAERAQDPCNTAAGEERVLRGGSWDDDADSCESAARYSEAPGLADVCFGYDAYGFRCVRRISESEKTE